MSLLLRIVNAAVLSEWRTTNTLLARIGNALERAYPPPSNEPIEVEIDEIDPLDKPKDVDSGLRQMEAQGENLYRS